MPRDKGDILKPFQHMHRQFIGGLERPKVDKITGLSPVISIEQKTTSKNPRSTVGTITEIYHFLRLLYARASNAYSSNTGEQMISYSNEEIMQIIMSEMNGKKLLLLAPIIRSRKGHRELFEQISKRILRVRVDGIILEIEPGMKLDRFKTHDIEIVVNRLLVKDANESRIKQSIETTLKHGKGLMMTIENQTDNFTLFQPYAHVSFYSGIAYTSPEPNSFSFNSPKGACSDCNGLGRISEIDIEKILPNKNLSINKGAIAPIAERKSEWILDQLEAIGKKYNFELSTPINEISKKGLDAILYGINDSFQMEIKNLGLNKVYNINFEGIVNFLKDQHKNSSSPKLKDGLANT